MLLIILLIIFYLLQYFLKDLFIPLRRIILFVEKVGELTSELIFQVVVIQPIGIKQQVSSIRVLFSLPTQYNVYPHIQNRVYLELQQGHQRMLFLRK